MIFVKRLKRYLMTLRPKTRISVSILSEWMDILLTEPKENSMSQLSLKDFCQLLAQEVPMFSQVYYTHLQKMLNSTLLGDMQLDISKRILETYPDVEISWGHNFWEVWNDHLMDAFVHQARFELFVVKKNNGFVFYWTPQDGSYKLVINCRTQELVLNCRIKG